MSSLVGQILNRTADKSIVRYGTIESASNGLASVRMGSAVVENATWLSGYLPSVGDRVAVLASGSGWLILGAVESVQRAYNEPETVLVKPAYDGQLSNILWSPGWDFDPLNPDLPPQKPEPLDGGWRVLTPSATGGGRIYIQADYFYVPSGGEWVNYVPSSGPSAGFLWYPRLDGVVPDNATIQSVSLIARLAAPRPDERYPFIPDRELPVVVHGHSLPPTATPAGSPPESYFNGSYPVIDSGVAAPGDTVLIPLPSQYMNGLVDGSLTGLAMWSGGRKRVVYDDHGTYHWVEPNSNSSGWYKKTYTTDDNLSLQVTYVTPVDEN